MSIATLLPHTVSLRLNFSVMKRLLFSAIILVVFSNLIFAQAYEGTTKYDKKTQRTVMIDYSYPPEAVQNAFVQKMSQLGYKPKEEKGLFNSDKGFLVFKNAYVTQISDQAIDYIVKVERKSRKESDQSVIYMIMLKGDQNVLEGMGANEVSGAKTFLDELLPEVEAANLELQIKDQDDKIAKAEKKLKGLKDDQANLEKKLKENSKDQEDTVAEIAAGKQALEALKLKRKTN